MIWGALWWSRGGIDGDREHLMYEHCKPVMFRTRQQCRDWINEKYGYMKTRKDLRIYPHGWRLPKPVKLSITLATGE